MSKGVTKEAEEEGPVRSAVLHATSQNSVSANWCKYAELKLTWCLPKGRTGSKGQTKMRECIRSSKQLVYHTSKLVYHTSLPVTIPVYHTSHIPYQKASLPYHSHALCSALTPLRNHHRVQGLPYFPFMQWRRKTAVPSTYYKPCSSWQSHSLHISSLFLWLGWRCQFSTLTGVHCVVCNTLCTHN
jgi:hypothetical protein